MNTKPDLSDEELRGYMNFDKLLEQRKTAVQKNKYVDLIRKGAILSAAVITLAIVWFNYRGETGGEQVVQETNQVSAPSPDAGEPATTGSDGVQSETPHQPPSPVTSTDDVREDADKFETVQAEEPPAKSQVEGDPSPPENNNATEYQYAEAEPVNGFPSLYEYFSKELVYPQQAIPDSIQGVVTVSFTIAVSGTPENIRIENSLGELFDEEVKRLIEKMPPWTPATVNAKPVPSRLSIPVTFQLQKFRSK